MSQFLLSPKLYFFSLIYFLLSSVLHWKLSPDLTIVFYGLGAVVGLHIITILEQLLKTKVLKNAVVQMLLYVVTFFILTSSPNIFGKGVVLFLNFFFWFCQWQEFKSHKSLDTWFTILNAKPTLQFTQKYIWLIHIMLGVQTALFIF